MIDNDSHETTFPPRPKTLRPRGTPTVPLNTLIHTKTNEMLIAIARRHNVGYGEVVDYLIQRAEAKRLSRLAKSVETHAKVL